MGAPRYNAASLRHKEDHYILPEQIIVDETLNGRFEPHSEQDVRDRAIDMLTNGQLAPVGVRKAHHDGGKPMLVYGFLRTKAALWINQQVVPKGGIQVGDRFIAVTKPFALWAAPAEGNDLESLKRNIVENLSRKATTVMDMVINQDRLRKQNMDDAEIALLYNTKVESVRRNAALLSLPRETQLLIHRGVITAEAGFDLLTLSEAEQSAVIQAEMDKAKAAGAVFDRSEQEFLQHQPANDAANPKFKAGTPAAPQGGGAKRSKVALSRGIKKAVRERKQQAGAKGPALTYSEFKKFLESLAESEDEPAIKEFAGKTLDFCRGDITEKQWNNAVTKLAGFSGK